MDHVAVDELVFDCRALVTPPLLVCDVTRVLRMLAMSALPDVLALSASAMANANRELYPRANRTLTENRRVGFSAMPISNGERGNDNHR